MKKKNKHLIVCYLILIISFRVILAQEKNSDEQNFAEKKDISIENEMEKKREFLDKKITFKFEGDLKDALSEFCKISGIPVTGSIKGGIAFDEYIPPEIRKISIIAENVMAREVFIQIAIQAKIGYEVNEDDFFVYPLPMYGEISEKIISEKVRGLLSDYLSDHVKNDILKITAPLIVAKELTPYLRSDNATTQEKALNFARGYFFTKIFIFSESREKIGGQVTTKEKEGTQNYLLKVYTEIIHKDLPKLGRILITSLARACPQKGIPLLKELLEKKEYDFYAAYELAFLNDDSGEKVLLKNLESKDRERRFEAAEILFNRLNNKSGLDVLIKDMLYVAEKMDRNEWNFDGTFCTYLRLIGDTRDIKAAPVLIELIMDNSDKFSNLVCAQLHKIAGWEDLPPDEFDTYFTPKKKVYENWQKWLQNHK